MAMAATSNEANSHFYHQYQENDQDHHNGKPPSYPIAPDMRSYKSACTANEYYAQGDYKHATREYTKAIAHTRLQLQYGRASDFCALLYSNRSASYLQLKQFEWALGDAESVVKISPSWAKGYFRMAEAYMGLEKYDEAVKCYIQAQAREPENTAISERLLLAQAKCGDALEGFEVYTLQPGKDIANKNRPYLAPVRTRIFEFAARMKNLIYIIADKQTRHCVIIDAGWDLEGIISFMRSKNLILKGCIVTHAHFDHTCGIPPPPFNQLHIKVPGVAAMAEMFSNIDVYVNPLDFPLLAETSPSLLLKDSPEISSNKRSSRTPSVILSQTRKSGEIHQEQIYESIPTRPSTSPISRLSLSSSGTILRVLGLRRPRGQLIPTPDGFSLDLGKNTHLQFIHSPGHTPGSQCILVNGCRLFAGDVLLCGGMTGRTDLCNGNQNTMVKTLKYRFAYLDDSVVIFPGHNYGACISTIGHERRMGTIGIYRGRTMEINQERSEKEDDEDDIINKVKTGGHGHQNTSSSTRVGSTSTRVGSGGGGQRIASESSDEEFPRRRQPHNLSITSRPNFLPPDVLSEGEITANEDPYIQDTEIEIEIESKEKVNEYEKKERKKNSIDIISISNQKNELFHSNGTHAHANNWSNFNLIDDQGNNMNSNNNVRNHLIDDSNIPPRPILSSSGQSKKQKRFSLPLIARRFFS